MNDKAIRAAKLTASGILEKRRAAAAIDRAGGQIAPSHYLPGVPRAVHADGGRIGKDYGGALGYVPQQWVQQQQQLAVAQPPQPPKQQQSSTMDALTQLAGIASQKPAEKPAETPSAATEGHPPTAGVSASAQAALDALRKGWTGQDFTVVSDYRDPNKNEAVGGAKGSQHLSGNAFDIDTSGWTPEQKLALATQAYQSGFRGYGFYDNNMHFDVGGQRAWGPSYHQDSIPEWAQDWTQRYIYADGGKVGGDSFKDWFGDSVTHTNGQPHVFYHGTSKDQDFTGFNVGRHGAWFTRDPDVASSYAEQNDSQGYKQDGWKMTKTNTASRVIPAYVKAENPYTGELPPEVMRGNYKKAQSDWFDTLRAKGHDAWMPASAGGNLVVALKEPQQIKSVYNSGKFDPKQKHMGKSGGGEVDGDQSITAYHGSPHDFDQFDIKKINTGEGAQSYGHGLYFAGNEGTAKYYRDTLRPDLPLVHIDGQNTGKRIMDAEPHIQNMLRNGMTPEQYHASLLNSPKYNALQSAYQGASDTDEGMGVTEKDLAKWELDDFHKKLNDVKGYFGRKVSAYVPTGHMYKVKIKAGPNELLDWDKTFSQQHPDVQEAIKATGVDTGAREWKTGADMGNGSQLIVTPHPDIPDDEDFTKYEMQTPSGSRIRLTRNDVARTLGGGNDITGAQIHQRLVDMGNRHGAIGEHLRAGNPMKTGPKWVAETLMRHGIKGIKYRDAGSRDLSDGDPTHNYVMFHHDPVKVVDKYEYGGRVNKYSAVDAAIKATRRFTKDGNGATLALKSKGK